jgi:hypothetical protein
MFSSIRTVAWPGLRHREHLALLDRRQLLAVAHERRLGEVELLGDRGQAQHVARGDHRAFVGDDDGVGERCLGRLEPLAGPCAAAEA